ncbi:MAG: hypothetical protein GY856_12305, partial [bacterium]|nr:hypothetical protein [bacterium]
MSEIRNPPSGPMELGPMEIAEALGRLRRALMRRRWTFLVVFVVIFSAIQAFAFFRPGTFAARAAILVQQTRFATRLNAASEDSTT